jgi:hypothetical protein
VATQGAAAGDRGLAERGRGLSAFRDLPKFLERIPGTHKRLYQFTAIDDCTRIRVPKVYDACNQRTAIRFIDEVLRRLPFRVHVVQTDNVLTQEC